MDIQRFTPDFSRAVLVIIDIQDKLLGTMPKGVQESVVKSACNLVRGAKELNIPILATEQYPQGLGNTIKEITGLAPELKPCPKLTFSCYRDHEFRKALEAAEPRDVILCGMESHLCVLPTTLELLEDEYNVFVAADAVCSRTKLNWKLSLEVMREAGATIGTTEMFLYQMVEEAGTERFKHCPYLKIEQDLPERFEGILSRRVTPPPLQVDIIVPVYNEEEVIGSFHQQLLDVTAHLPYRFTITYVDDGSKDKTLEKLKAYAAQDRRVSILELSRNFGHQAALTAGMDASTGDYVITLDGDGQHPPAMIAEMLRLAEGGYDLVLTQRLEQKNLSAFKRWSSNLFYNFSNHITETPVVPGGADFRLLKRPVIEALRGMREYHRFLRGMVAWTGFRSVILPFTPPERMAGKSKFSLPKMLQLASDAIFSFSLAPLYLSLSMGLVFFILALAEVIYVLSFWISGRTSSLAPGWSSLMFVLLMVGGFIMLLLGFIGIYVGYIFQEVKRRPIYLVRNTWNTPSTENKELE